MRQGFWIASMALDSDRFPRSVVVLGGGAIALEFAHFYNALGLEVTVLQRSNQVIKEADSDVAEALVAAFQKRGIKVICGTRLIRVERTATGKSVWYERNGKEQVAEADEILYALGRTPAVAGLGLDKAGVETNKKKARDRQRQAANVAAAYFCRRGRYRAVRNCAYRNPAGRDGGSEREELAGGSRP